MAITDMLRAFGAGLRDAGSGLASGAQAAGSQLGNLVNNIGAEFRPPADPNAIDPVTGLPAGMVHAAKLQSLQRMAMLFSAAGQSMSGSDRARILAELGNAANPTKDLYTMAQARLMHEQIAEALRKRERREQALEALRKKAPAMEFLTDRERMVLDAYLTAGDPEGALDFISKTNNQMVQLSDGTVTSRGVLQSDTQTWNKAYLPTLQNLDQKYAILSDALDIMEGGFTAGQLTNQVLVAEKLARYFGHTVRPETLNTEKVRSLLMNLVVERMKDLGGNDSYQELDELRKLFAGDKLEPETIINNLHSFGRRLIRDSVVAAEQKKRVGRPDFGLTVDFSPDMIPEQYRPLWDRVNGNARSADGTAAFAGAPPVGTVVDGYRYKGGDPSSASSWERVQ